MLIERRPDLPHIPLTCENTHTALPYIDIVNEILEYYVANGKLEEQAAHDTGDATTAELLAEPQNVIREAYDKLREARYPLNLPFDLWLETVRQFCNYFETPLARVLEVFRPSDDLFAPAQPFDRATHLHRVAGLSPAEVAIFTDPDPLATWHELYGFTTAAEATTEATDADDRPAYRPELGQGAVAPPGRDLQGDRGDRPDRIRQPEAGEAGAALQARREHPRRAASTTTTRPFTSRTRISWEGSQRAVRR